MFQVLAHQFWDRSSLFGSDLLTSLPKIIVDGNCHPNAAPFQEYFGRIYMGRRKRAQ